MALLVAGAGVCPVQQPLLEVLGLTAGADAVAICASAGQMMMGADDAQIAAAVEAVMQQWFRVYVVCASLLHAGLGAPLKISTVLPLLERLPLVPFPSLSVPRWLMPRPRPTMVLERLRPRLTIWYSGVDIRAPRSRTASQ